MHGFAPNVDDSLVRRFQSDGFLLCPSLFTQIETASLRAACAADPEFVNQAHFRTDPDGLVTRVYTWDHLNGGAEWIRRICQRVDILMEDVLQSPVHHFQTKLTAKDAFHGGSWPWHQDYWNYYHHEFLFPDMANCYVALDPAWANNGCLKLLKGSHLLGRIDHVILEPPKANQGSRAFPACPRIGADPERVEQVSQIMDEIDGVMQAGDALIFHGNTLHRSDANRSRHPRWGLVLCYTRRSNVPPRPNAY